MDGLDEMNDNIINVDFSHMAITAPPRPSKWDIIPIHSSDRAAFKFCRRQWAWSSPSRLNLIPRAEVYGVDKNLWFGTGIHYALEQFYNPVLKRDPTEAWLSWFELQWRGGFINEDEIKQFADRNPRKWMDEVQRIGYMVDGLCDILPDTSLTEEDFMVMKDVGVGMMNFYKGYAEANDNFAVILLEHDFSVPVINSKGEVLYAVDDRIMPDGWEPNFDIGNEFGPLMREPLEDYLSNRVEKQVHVRGRMDMIVQEQEYGRFQIVDHKTAARIDEDYFRHLELDEQCTCVPMDTEALTPDGWKNYDELNIGDIILAYDRYLDELKWTPILSLNHGEGELLSFRNQQGFFRARTTAMHRWVGRRRVGAGRSDEHWNLWEVETYKLPISHGKIIVAAKETEGGEYTITPNEAAIIGWILGDGHFNFHNNTLTVSISQAIHKYADEIAGLLSESGLKYSTAVIAGSGLSEKPQISWRFATRQIQEIFERAGIDYTGKKNEQDYTDLVLGLSVEAREAFAEAGLKAEGSINNDRANKLDWLCQNDGPIKDAFRLAFFLNGIYTTFGTNKGFGLKVDRELDSRTLHWEYISEREEVWCPMTQYGTWVMRQGRQICITGNSYLSFGELEAKIHNLEYSSLDAITYQAILKGYPKPPTITSRGLPSLNRNEETTTAEMFAQCIKDHGLEGVYAVDEKMQSYYTYLLDLGDKRYILRTDTWRNRMQKKNAMTRLYYEAIDMLSNPVCYPNPSKNYSCLNCKFRVPCIQAESGDDYMSTLEDGYISNWDR